MPVPFAKLNLCKCPGNNVLTYPAFCLRLLFVPCKKVLCCSIAWPGNQTHPLQSSRSMPWYLLYAHIILSVENDSPGVIGVRPTLLGSTHALILSVDLCRRCCRSRLLCTRPHPGINYMKLCTHKARREPGWPKNVGEQAAKWICFGFCEVGHWLSTFLCPQPLAFRHLFIR